MDETKARAVADALNGEARNTGGGIWLVILEKPDGRLVAISDDLICEYSDSQSFDDGHALTTIILPAGCPA